MCHYDQGRPCGQPGVIKIKSKGVIPMSKKKARIILILLAASLVLLLYTAFIGWGPTGTGAMKNIKLGLDLEGGVSVTYQAKEDNPSAEDMADTVYKLQKRVDAISTEAHVYQEGSNRINIEIPGVSNAEEILSQLGKPGSLKFELSDGTEILDGSHIESAEAASTRDNMNNTKYVVEVTFDKKGAKAFGDATTKNVGKPISIVYDGETISSPVVQQAITDGKCEISGNFTLDSAKELASSIRIGSLSLELEEIRSQVVGAQLGQQALKTSLIGGIIGVICVMIIMIIAYKVPGIVASFALLLYTALDLVAMNAFDMTLTLPGIAGVILSIGMAVDANVIIYARIREEIAGGNSVRSAIDTGFRKALSAIIDGNVTTLIACLVLYIMGTGSVKGFAESLALGIFLSMFTALFVSKWIVQSFYELGMSDPKCFGKMIAIKRLNMVGRRKLFFTIALIAILTGPVACIANHAAGRGALNFSMEFRGGTSTDVTFKDSYDINAIDTKIKPVIQKVIGEAEVQAQKVAGGNEIIFKTRTLSNDERQKLSDALDKEFPIDTYKDNAGEQAKAISFETISGTVSNEMRRDAVVAVIIAVVCMLIYIWFRFSDLRFASSAIIALIHDVLVVFASYAITRISVGGTFIAVMLTIVGYSINSTIVIFDRVRE
ncbi:MAG TPA: protein translocase subunit SecD, partial [Lachnospiraceae bacterium]|nr:protein translocase subunit SecD [Lachnospiraceae bacterium]